MRAGGDYGDDGLGEFVSEADEAAAPPAASRSASRHALESPRLVPIVVALAVIGYGSLMVVWWERDTPELKPSFSSTPTTSYRPSVPPAVTVPAPQAATPMDPAPQVAIAASVEVPPDAFVPAVARAGGGSRLAETAPALPEALPPRVSDGEEDVVPAPVPSAPPVFEPPAPAMMGEAVAAAPIRPIEPTPSERLAADRTAISGVLQSYRAAYNALDATTVSTIWQGLDTRALQKAFSTLSRQDVAFDRCDVRLTASDHAVASCRGVLSYVPKIGDGEPQQRRLSWSFDFRRADDRWLISSVSAR